MKKFKVKLKVSTSDDYQEQVALNEHRFHWPESPTLEGAASKAIENAFRELIEELYLYQKVTVDLTDMEAAVKAAILLERIKAGKSIAPYYNPPEPPTPERLAELRNEVAARPWRLATRHLGDNPAPSGLFQMAVRAGAQPIPANIMEVNLHFCLPAVRPQRDFSDLQRTDWYEDLKRQQTLKKIADLKLQWIARIEIDPSYSARLRETLAKERAAHKANYEALSSIISKILTAKENILNTKS